jgi:hypothetical protein
MSACSGAHVAADVVEANAFWYWEDWDDDQALEGELRTDRFSQLLALVETSAQPPVFEFRVIPEIRGLDYLAAVREAAEPKQESLGSSPGGLTSTDLAVKSDERSMGERRDRSMREGKA